MTTTERNSFVRALLDLYLGLPHSAARRPSPADRRLAGQLFDRGVPFDLIQAAFMLATLRRVNRPLDATPLPPVRSLHYFVPVLTELLASPLDPAYVQYLHDRFHAIAHRPDGHSATVSDGR
jgi:hypothetical protein